LPERGEVVPAHRAPGRSWPAGPWLPAGAERGRPNHSRADRRNLAAERHCAVPARSAPRSGLPGPCCQRTLCRL